MSMGSTNRDDGDGTFRPPWWLLTFWLLSGTGMLSFGVLIFGQLISAPGWVRVSFLGISGLALMEGLILSFAVVRVGREGLVSRHHTRWSARWEQIDAWSQWGPGGSVYVRTRDGDVRGFSSWCVYGTAATSWRGRSNDEWAPLPRGSRQSLRGP